MAQIDRIIWSERAWADIDSIIEYISKDSEYYAKNFATKIINAVELLKIFPEMGRITPEIGNPAIRELQYKPYRIVYKILENTVEILTVYHGSRLFDTDLEE